MNYLIKEINAGEAKNFLSTRHYSGRNPQVSFAYGLFDKELKLRSVITIGKPASNQLCFGVCGKDYSRKVYELNRLCTDGETLPIKLSKFVSVVLKKISKIELIIISYADTAMNHAGYIYQATNFIYTGKTKKRTDKYTHGNKHSRHYNKNVSNNIRKVRSPKHRYIYFAGSKKFKKIMLTKLKYNIFDYPKTENKNYVLGEFIKPELIVKK